VIVIPTIRNSQADPVRILLVEDDDVAALLLQKTLEHSLHCVFELSRADCLCAALREVAEGGVDLILLDLGLPDSNGLDTFVRMHSGATRVPIIVLSGLDDETLATLAVQQGAQDYIFKGQQDGDILARAIRYAIERSRIQQELAENYGLLRSVIDNLPDQVYLKDRENRFMAVNPVTSSFFGASSPDQIVGKTDFDYFPRELAAQFLEEEQMLLRRDQASVNREVAVTDAEGNNRWMLTTKVPLHDPSGNITGLLGINRDITERKQAEDGIRRMNTELERRVAERTDALLKAVARLEEHDRLRAEFVSSVSHELKTPLTSMRFAISNLLDGIVGSLPDPVAQYLQLLDTDCRRMANTVDDILDFSSLESKAMQLHMMKLPFDRLIQRGVMSLRIQAQANNIEMVFSLSRGLGFVECDAFKMTRAIINIIGNAIKFTPRGGRVEIGLRHDATVSGNLVADITDNGIGIAPQHLARVAERYFRVDEHVSGTGLGLTIAKEIIEIHGGQMRIQSPPSGRDRGTRVSISLPRADPPTILMANVDQPAKELIEQVLNSCGYHVIDCSHLDEIIELARKAKPAAVILDVSTADMSHADLILNLRNGDLQAIPCLGVANGSLDTAWKAILKGLELPLLPESWREEDLLECIESLIRGVSMPVISPHEKKGKPTHE
jgi:PAS domain S-box-containing protein